MLIFVNVICSSMATWAAFIHFQFA